MGELFSEFGDLVFSLVIGYISAIEFLYVVRHLYHYSFNHDAQPYDTDDDNLSQLQNSMRQQLDVAKHKESIAGTQVMKDGVPYKDGYRLEAQQSIIDQLKEQLKGKELSDLRRQEIEKELAKQMKIAEGLRKELTEAEAKYQRQQRQEEEEEAKAKKLLEEQQKREKEEQEQQRKREEEEQQRKREEEEQQAKKEAEHREQEKRKREEQERKDVEEQERKMADIEKQREAEQRQREEAEEQARKLAEAEKQREAEQRQREEAEEQARKLAEAEKQRDAQQRQREEAEKEQQRLAEEQRKRDEEEKEQEQIRQEAEKESQRLQELEKQREQEQRHQEEQAEQKRLEAEKQATEEAEAAAAKTLLEIEHRLEEQLRAAEKEAELTEKERQLIESIKKRDLPEHEGNEQKEAELLRKILAAREQLGEESEEEQSFRLIQRERDQEAKQKRIEENALLFLEAEKEMAELQAKMLDAVEKREYGSPLDSAPQTPAIEEPCIKRTFAPLLDKDSAHYSVKTQLAQDFDEPYSVSSKPLLFPGVSDDASSIDPASSQQSSFNTQPSDDLTTGTESQYPAQERQEPDGEDTALNNMQYSDDYLRSLDGIKQRPLVREDGSGRRRAFKKRRSSNSSNSSRDSRHSRDEELKMFTSLEEEEMKDNPNEEFTPIRYTNEPTLKVKGHHHRRHKRSPAKDMRHSDDSLRSSLERLGEETSDPWGEVKPEHYKHTEFWKREKALSIDEETEFEKPASTEEVAYDTATNMPSASSFEEATQMQNEEALTALQKHSASWTGGESATNDKATVKEESTRSDNTNLQTSPTAEREASPARSSASPRLRRSPRIEEIDQYEERWKESNDISHKASVTSPTQNTPTINVQTPLDFGPWRDEHGLMMEGLSDFYDFTASVNPSRSRDPSRNPSPANTAPNTPLPRDVSFQLELTNEEDNEKPTVEIYDDTENLQSEEFKKENIIKFIESLNGNEEATVSEEEKNKVESAQAPESSFKQSIQYVADDPNDNTTNEASLVPLVNIIDESASNVSTSLEINEPSSSEMNALISTLRSQQAGRSRSKSPLPTAGNLQRSVENRRNKMIKHNEDILEKLIESKLLPELTSTEELEQIKRKDSSSDTDNTSQEQMDSLGQTLRVDRGRSRSKSPMRLPTAENLSKGLEKRRTKLIERNDELIKQLEERSLTPESPSIEVEFVYEIEDSKGTNITTQQQTPTIAIGLSQNVAPISPSEEDDFSKEKINLLVESLSVAQSKSRSKSPMPMPEAIEVTIVENETPVSPTEVDDCSREKMDLLVQSLRVAQSRSRSKSPMPMPEATEVKIYTQFQHTEHMETTQYSEILNAPTISINFAETETELLASPKTEDDNCSREQMESLVQSLRVARSRSASKSPMRLPSADNLSKSLDTRRNKLIERNDELFKELEERAKTPEPSNLTVEYVYEIEKSDELESEDGTSRYLRSRTPSRSPSRSRSRSLPPRPTEMELAAYRSKTPSRSVSPQPEESDEFHILLNLESSVNKTLSISSEEQESLILANRLKQLDEEALEKLKNVSEEIELRTLSPLILDKDEQNEQQSQDLLADLPLTERAKLLRKSPTTPDYDRTISEEMRDVERIKRERIEKGFQRSTYVGESMDLGSEFEPLRREAALFQRSRTPSPSTSVIDSHAARKIAEEKRNIQDLILQELTTTSNNDSQQLKSTGAIPKTERLSSSEIELTVTNEIEDTIRIKETHDDDKTLEYEEMRRRNAEFRRSGSASRSPLQESQLQELAGIEVEAAKRESSMNFHDFSRHLNTDFFVNERRASDSALIQKPEILVQIQEDFDLDPEEYHHFRRFSLAQEQPIEQYPSDDYIFVEQVEVRTRSGSRTWVREDFYSDEVDKYLEKCERSREKSTQKETVERTGAQAQLVIDQPGDEEENVPVVYEDVDDEDYSNGSDDDRQTVVEVDDEIDEDISDFNERGPAEESHHETSECEEAEREMDRYADREASDWNRAVDVDDILVNEHHANELVTSEEDEGAVGGLSNSPYDSDSFAIDQIYDEAIKNRKQSGILREYDSILMQMSTSGSEPDDQYLLWSKTQGKKKPKNIEFNTQFLDNERKDSEMRYLGDANLTARQSARLRSRYGYNPVLQAKCIEDDLEVDLNYKPKREYNWRKNFKLEDDENIKEDKEITLEDLNFQDEQNINDEINEREWTEMNVKEDQDYNVMDTRKYSLGGESVTLFSRSPERKPSITEEQYADNEEPASEILVKEEIKEERLEKPKKKKTKKKLHKESKSSLEETMNKEDEEAYDHEVYSRRSSSLQMETDSPKRKSRSRRSSKSSLTNEESMGLFSPRSSVTYAEPIADIMEEFTDMQKESIRPKKMKKRKKVKESMANVVESPIEQKEEFQYNLEPLNDIPTVSAVVTPESSLANILSTLSPQNSVCVTPASIDTDINLSVEELRDSSIEMSVGSSSTTASSPAGNLSRTSSLVTTPVDTFDILKDANFYPLF